jgi:hypothetical protein
MWNDLEKLYRAPTEVHSPSQSAVRPADPTQNYGVDYDKTSAFKAAYWT